MAESVVSRWYPEVWLYHDITKAQGNISNIDPVGVKPLGIVVEGIHPRLGSRYSMIQL